MPDDFDAYLGKAMATTTFFPTAPSESCTLQIFVSGREKIRTGGRPENYVSITELLSDSAIPVGSKILVTGI
jgi:hypothetical protein